MHNIAVNREACTRPRYLFLVALKRRHESGPTQHTAPIRQFCVLPNRLGGMQ